MFPVWPWAAIPSKNNIRIDLFSNDMACRRLNRSNAATTGQLQGRMAGVRSDDMGPLPLWFVWALGSAVFAGITAVLAKAGLEDVDPDLATLVRTGIVALFLPLLLVAAGKWSNPFELSGRTWWFLGFSGIATGLSWICYFRALKAGQASLVVPVDRLSLLVVALLAFLFLDERPSILGWIGLLLVGGGGLLFSLSG